MTMIAVGAGVGSFATQSWMPFLPLYMLQIGARSDASALFWVAMATAGQGVGRIIGGPIWGIVADRYGRKLMYVRALYGATVTIVVVGVATAPWQVTAAFVSQGLVSGFIPAATALTSVSVPRTRLTNGLAMLTGAQYLGTTIGPALGALTAAALGLRGAILATAALPSLAALLITVFVPRDIVERRPASTMAKTRMSREQLAALIANLSLQFAIALFLYFVLYSTSNVLRIATPIFLKTIQHGGSNASATGIAFTFSGLGSVVGALGLARLTFRHHLRLSLVVVLAGSAVAYVLLATAGSVPVYIVWFGLVAVAQGAMIPATNTLIATSVAPERRGTAFGIASSVQAIAFVSVAPIAAGLARFSITAGFVAIAVVLLLTAALVFAGLKEPAVSEARS